VRGKRFSTSVDTLLSIKDTLFYKLLISKKFDLNKELFFNRSHIHFGIILNFLRYKKISFEQFSWDELEDLKKEAEYYEITPIYEYVNNLKNVKFISINFNQITADKKLLGTGKLSDLKDRNLSTGICTDERGYVDIEFEEVVEFEKIEIGPYAGNKGDWLCHNGRSSVIYTSLDNITMNDVGFIPEDYEDKIIPVKIKKTSAKFIHFRNDACIGIGYLNIIKLI
jgi:hypothetical protein